ncbi:MAG TPA: PAS domain-containing protein, partial [Candidatus Kryptonia bacterium]|nr:PAS domain-containing protein [Candidatus Kryptonia bacterium]
MATQSAVDGSADFKWRRRARLGRKLSQPQTEHADFRLTYLLALILGIVLVAGFTWSIVERERRNTLGYWNANLTGAARLAWVRVSDWLNERRSNGEVIATSAVVRAVLTKPLGSDAKEDVEVRERATVEHPRYESPSVQQVLGYDPSDLIGGGVFDLIDPDDLARAQQALQSAVD